MDNIVWYRNIPTIIPMIVSILALLFSFGTTYVSNKRTAVQDIQNAKINLRTVLQKLTDLPSKNMELSRKYKDDAQAYSFFSGQITQETGLLVAQADEIIKGIPKNRITSVELYSIGLGFQGNYEYERALDYFKESYKIAEKANNFSVAIASKRGEANILFVNGKPDEGREVFDEAMKIFNKFNRFNEFTKNFTNIITLLNWAGAEAGTGNLKTAEEKINEARNLANSLLPGPMKIQLKNQIEQTYNQIITIKPK